MLVFYVFREVRLPKYAVKQSRDMRKVFLFEVASILWWIFIVILFIEFRLRVTWDNAIFSIDVYHVYCFAVNGIIFGGQYLIELCLIYKCNWKVLKDLQTSLSSPAPPSYSKYHGRQFFWDLFFFNLLAYMFEVVIAVVNVKILVGAVAMEKRRAYPHL
jgi:hypothetical protein